MKRLVASPKPVRTGRYRYSKLRWRVLVHTFDFFGRLAIAIVRRYKPVRPIDCPRRILLVQLDHLGDAVLSTPLIAELRAAYPEAMIDVLASPSNHEVFEADPQVNRVQVAERTWFERRPERWGLVTAVWKLGRSLRKYRYDLGIDVRGDVLSVLVLALARVPRRVGWSMGGGSFLLTDVAAWIPGRHEVRSRLALLGRLGIIPDEVARVEVAVRDLDRITVARRLGEAWPRRAPRRTESFARVARRERGFEGRLARVSSSPSPAPDPIARGADWLHADRFSSRPPLLAVHLGAGNAAKRWPARAWKVLVERFLASGWRVVVVGGVDDVPLSSALEPHDRLRLDRQHDRRPDDGLPRESRPLHRRGFRPGTPGGLGGYALGHPVQRHQPGPAVAPWSRHSLVLRHRVPCHPCHQKVCPLAGHPCMAGLHPDRVYRGAMRWWKRTHRAESPHAPL